MDPIGAQGSMMAMAHLQLTDELQVEGVAMQMMAQRKKHEWEQWKLFQDLQTSIYETQQEVCLQRAKTQDKIFGKWDDYIKA